MELAERKAQADNHGSRRANRRTERGNTRESSANRSASRTRRASPDRGGRGRAAHDAGDTTRDDEQFIKEHGDELSRSAQHAKWIHSTGDHEDHDGQTLATRSADVIRQWAEERKAQPATTPGGDAERPRVLRFDFPGYERELQHISWDAWLRTFEARDLVFLYQEHMKAGNQSNFFRLDSPHREEG